MHNDARGINMNYIEQDYDNFVKKLEEDFPKIFTGTHLSIEVGPGWWPIIERLCRNIQSHIDWKQAEKEKYNRGDGCPQAVVVQIKEKFGELRFYCDGGDQYIDGLIQMATEWAGKTCEACGMPGKRTNTSWIKTLCEQHSKELEQKWD